MQWYGIDCMRFLRLIILYNECSFFSGIVTGFIVLWEWENVLQYIFIECAIYQTQLGMYVWGVCGKGRNSATKLSKSLSPLGIEPVPIHPCCCYICRGLVKESYYW